MRRTKATASALAGISFLGCSDGESADQRTDAGAARHRRRARRDAQGSQSRTARTRRTRSVGGDHPRAVHGGAHRLHALRDRCPVPRPRRLRREDRAGCGAVADCAGCQRVCRGGNGCGQCAPSRRQGWRSPLRVTGGHMTPRRSRLRDARGTSLVEAALIAPLLIFLTISIVDFGLMFYAHLALENGISQATRFAVTGNLKDDPANPGNALSRTDSIKLAMRQATPTLTI